MATPGADMTQPTTHPEPSKAQTTAARDAVRVHRSLDEPGVNKPDYLVVGAAKSATTWITERLRVHPSVFMPGGENHYFSNAYDYVSVLSPAYLENFAQAKPGQIIGENSNSYWVDPGAPARIADALPNAKIIISLRNPIDRAYSEYCMHYRTGRVSDDVAAYLDPERTQKPVFIQTSMFFTLLQRYQAYFTQNNIHLVFQDDLKTDPAGVLQGLHRFLGVEPMELDAAQGGKVNAGEHSFLPRGVRRFVNHTKVGRVMAGAAKATGTNQLLIRLMGKKIEYPPLPDGLRQKMAEYFRPEIEQLSAYANRPLDTWIDCDRS